MIFLSAIIVGVIAVAVLSGYTSSVASKLPEQNDLIQVFLSGAAVGSFMSWLVTSGLLHGSSFLGMLSADVSSLGASLKGGDSVAPASAPVASTASTASNSAVPAESVSNMVGGFFKAMGLDSSVLQELNVGMPAF